MRALEAADILGIWERGADLSPVDRALVILAFAFPKVPAAALSNLTIGQRDAWLIRLRALTFGPQLTGLAVCPACGERLELAFSLTDLQKDNHDFPEPGSSQVENKEISLSVAPYEVTFRLPTSADLRRISLWREPDQASQQLLEACVIKIQHGENEIPASDLPDHILEALTTAMSQTEPLADLSMATTCPACGHSWKVLFDIVSFFWGEIIAWAARLLHEVHILASAYGWREADILALSTFRRQRYLEFIGA